MFEEHEFKVKVVQKRISREFAIQKHKKKTFGFYSNLAV